MTNRRPKASWTGRAALLFAAALLCGLISTASAQDGSDPSTTWFQGFVTFEAAQELEKQGKLLEALNKCGEAEMLYRGLARNHPEFQPDIVRLKQRTIADAMLRIRDATRRKKQGLPVQARPTPAVPQRNLPQVSREGVPLQGTPVIGNNGGSNGTPDRYGGPGVAIARPPVEQQYYQGAGGSEPLPNWGLDPRAGVANQLLHQSYQQQASRDSEIAFLNRENRRLKAERDSYEDRLQTAERRARQLQYERDQLRRQMDSDPTKAGQLRRLLDETLAELRKSTEQNATLVKQLRTARQSIAAKDKEIADLKAERDQLLSVIQGKGVGDEAFRKLIEKNEQLEKRLDLAEKVALNASANSRQREQDILTLKQEINKVRAERDKLVAENVRHQQEIETLHQKLEMLSDGLTASEKMQLGQVSPEQKAENALLRSMVLKQLRHQAHQKQAKELLLRQLEGLGNRSAVLLELVEDIARGPQLTPEERKIFRSPQVADLIADVSPAYQPPADPNVVEGTLSAPAFGSVMAQRVVDGQKIEVELSQLDKAARLDFSEGRFTDAEAGFLKYLHYRPRSVPCLCNLGALKMTTQSYADAQHYLTKAIAIDRDHGRAHYLLGRTFFYQNQSEAALNHLERSIQLEPGNAKAHNSVGVIASQRGWIAKAQRAFEQAVSIDPSLADAHFNLAALFSSAASANPKKAGEHYFKALDLKVPRDAAIETFLKNAVESGASIELGQL